METRTTLEHTRQQDETEEEFYDTFRSHVKAFEHFGGNIGNDEGLILELKDESSPDHPGDMPDKTDTTLAEVKEWITKVKTYEIKIRAAARERYLAMMFLKKVNRKKYGDLWVSLKNNYSRGTDQYPHTLSDAYSLVCSHTPEIRDSKKNRDYRDRLIPTPNPSPQPPDISFLQQHEIVPDTGENTFPNVTCFKCRTKGHYANKCPNASARTDFNAL